MRGKSDLVKGWLRKAESDFENLELCLEHNRSLDTACFHAQQAAEKYLKAFLLYMGEDFPFVHNIEKLLELCGEKEASFLDLIFLGEKLTPFAVSLRYDEEFWPSRQLVEEARDVASRIRMLVAKLIPPRLWDFQEKNDNT